MHRKQIKPIYVDFDDVLCETALAFTHVLEREFGKRVRFEDIVSFNLGRSFGLSDADLEHLFDILHQPEELLAIKPVPGAVHGLQQWAVAGCDVRIVTGRPPSTAVPSRTWMERYGIPHASLTFVDKYARNHVPHEGETLLTLEQLAEAEFCLAVEDSPEMAVFIAQEMRLPVALLDRPWNASLDCAAHEGIVRCEGWSDLLHRFPHPA